MNKIRHITSVATLVSVILAFFVPSSAAQSAPTVITMWHVATESDPFYRVLRRAVDDFNAAHSDARIEARSILNETFKEELERAMAVNDPPDVFQTWGGGLLENYVRLGIVREISAPGLSQRFAPGVLAFSTIGDKHYAVPANLAGVFLWYNEELFTRFKVPLPTTWGQLIAACHSFREVGVIPIALGNKDRWPGAFWLTYLAMRIGGEPVFIDHFLSTDSATFQNPSFVEAGRRIQEAVQAGCFEDAHNHQDFGMAQQLLGNGSAAMQLQGDWNHGGLLNVDSTRVENEIKVLPFPTIDGGRGNTTQFVGGTGHAFAIAAGAPPETTDALIELLTSDAFGRSVAEAGFIPALAGYDQRITAPLIREMTASLVDASYIQLYYDQLFPPALAEAHLTTTQQLFDLSLTPEEAAQKVSITAEKARAVVQTSAASLRDLAEARSFSIGAAVSINPLRNDPTYAETLSREFNMLTPETAMKMETLLPNRDTFSFDEADYIVRFAEAHDMQIRGHTLVWYNQLPGWVADGQFTREELLTILREYIVTVVGRYKGRVAMWDVVNEAIADDGSLRNNIWLQVIGPDYIAYAFQWAHEADPGALLFYNDYDTEGLGTKSDAVYLLVEGLAQRGVPIHGVGLQMHINISRPPQMEAVKANMQRLAALGLQVQITEMDVQIQDGQGPDEERFGEQARLYADVADVCLSTPACTALVLWGFTDQHSWIPAYTGRADAPLIFDPSYQPKPAYHALFLTLAN